MTDKQFKRIKKGLNFHSEGGIDNLCTMTETTLRKIVEDAVKLYEKQQKIDTEQIQALQKQNGELTNELKDLRESIKDYGAGCYEKGLRNGKRKLKEQLTKAKEIIKYLCGMVRELNKPNVQLTNVDYSLSEAEQFLSEVENV
jgi:hypothetical protein